jgi:hypothetical protein
MSISDYQAIVTSQIDKMGLGDGNEGLFMLQTHSLISHRFLGQHRGVVLASCPVVNT